MKLPPPHGLDIFKGSKNVVLTREFADGTMRHPYTKRLLAWLRNVAVPDEFFFPTMVRVRQEEGGGFVQDKREDAQVLGERDFAEALQHVVRFFLLF